MNLLPQSLGDLFLFPFISGNLATGEASEQGLALSSFLCVGADSSGVMKQDCS